MPHPWGQESSTTPTKEVSVPCHALADKRSFLHPTRRRLVALKRTDVVNR